MYTCYMAMLVCTGFVVVRPCMLDVWPCNLACWLRGLDVHGGCGWVVVHPCMVVVACMMAAGHAVLHAGCGHVAMHAAVAVQSCMLATAVQPCKAMLATLACQLVAKLRVLGSPC